MYAVRNISIRVLIDRSAFSRLRLYNKRLISMYASYTSDLLTASWSMHVSTAIHIYNFHAVSAKIYAIVPPPPTSTLLNKTLDDTFIILCMIALKHRDIRH